VGGHAVLAAVAAEEPLASFVSRRSRPSVGTRLPTVPGRRSAERFASTNAPPRSPARTGPPSRADARSCSRPPIRDARSRASRARARRRP
jgi:hypothetical protein